MSTAQHNTGFYLKNLYRRSVPTKAQRCAYHFTAGVMLDNDARVRSHVHHVGGRVHIPKSTAIDGEPVQTAMNMLKRGVGW